MANYQRMHSDLSSDKAPVQTMRRIHSDIASSQQQEKSPVQSQLQGPPAVSLDPNHPLTTPGSTLPPTGFQREKSVYQMLGGGNFADIVLWRQKRKATCILGGSTAVWFIFEWSGYTLISLLANAILFILVALFAWANVAALVNRPLPPVPDVQVTDEKVNKVAKCAAVKINGILHYGRNLSTGKDFPMLFKACTSLYILSSVGQWFSLLTLVYLSILVALTLPMTYEKHEQAVDQFLQRINSKLSSHYHKLEECMNKIPVSCK